MVVAKEGNESLNTDGESHVGHYVSDDGLSPELNAEAICPTGCGRRPALIDTIKQLRRCSNQDGLYACLCGMIVYFLSIGESVRRPLQRGVPV